MGADLTYECLGGETYKIRLTLYRNCEGSALSDKLQIAFSSDSCGIPLVFDSVARVNIIDVSPLCPASQPLSNCINPSNPFPGVEEHSYELDYTLPTQCPDWKVAWSICCRNPSVTNSIIPTFSSTRIYVEATINNLDVTCNSSPTFIQRPVTYICSGQPVQFNGGATEPDGDSLTFELVDPLDGPYGGAIVPVPYESGFNEFYPLTTSPINTFNFDNSSGQFSFTPQGQQSGIVAVLVKEYREGKCIGSTMRDMQWVVTNCFNQTPIINPPNNISGAQFTGNTFSVCAGNTLSFNLTALDLDPGNVLTITENVAQAIPGATVIYSQGSNPSVITFDWPTSLSDTGNYFISFNVRDNGCPTEGEQSVGYNIIVQEGEVLPPQVITYCPSTVDSIQLLPTSTGPGTYTWTPSLGLSDSSIRDPFLTLPPSGIASPTVIYQAPGAGVCPILEPFEVIPEGTIAIPNDTLTICQGDTVQLQTSFDILGPPVFYAVLWSPAIDISNPSVDSPFVYPTTTTLYNVSVVTTNGCTYDADVLVQVDVPPSIDPIPDQNLCFGDSVQLNVTGTGLANATYGWTPVLGLSDPTSPAPMVSPTTTTTFSVRATNRCGVDTASTTVNVFSPLQLSLGKTDIDCNGAANGTITAVTFGGSNSGRVYIWPTGVTQNTDTSAINLGPGTYSVMVADDAGCMVEDSITITEPSPLTLAPANVVDVNCFGETTGSVTLSAAGGTPGYEYSRDNVTFFSSPTFINLAAGTYDFQVRDQNGCVTTLSNVLIQQPASPVTATVLNSVLANCTSGGEFLIGASGGTGVYQWSLDGGANFQDSGRFVNLQPGFYQILVRDASGCETTLNDSIRETSDPVATIDSLANVSCFGDTNGVVRLTISEGQPPYSLLFDNVATSDTFFDTLAAGYHFFQVTDLNTCKYAVVFFIDEPDSLYGIVANSANVSCPGGNDGSLLLQGFGGTPPYRYAIDNGPFTTDSLFTGLTAKTYVLEVLDANNCLFTFGADISESNLLELLVTPTNIACAGEQNGELLVAGVGGSPAYAYSINGSSFVNDTLFQGLGAGSYQMVVEDREGCRDTVNTNIIEPSPLSVSLSSQEDADCFGASSGSVTLVGAGGTAPYSFSEDLTNFTQDPVRTGLRAGEYTFLVQDDRGCLAEVQATIDQPDPLSGVIDAEDVTCFEANDGRGVANMQGGTTPYAYLWSNGASTREVNNLPPGNPWVLITDVNGCQLSLSTEISEPPALSIDSSQVQPASCFGASDGFLQIYTSGGVPPYRYNWSNGATDSILLNLPAGDYIGTLIDQNGCEERDTLTINQPPEIVIEITDQKDAFCGLANGEVTVEATGGAESFSYIWSNGQTGPTAIELMGGPSIPPYEVIATDTTGCSNSLSVTLEIGGEPTAAFETNYTPQDTIPLIGNNVQLINLSVDATDYLWAFGDGNFSNEENPTHIYEESGSYTIELVAYDPLFLCPDTAYLTLFLVPPGIIYVPNVFTPNGDNRNDDFFAVGIQVASFQLDIYDRWGRLLKTLFALEDYWDGTNKNNNPVQEGVYVWKMRATLNDGSRVDKVGTVTLVR
ncbi:MAG: gliding motility-associated C-terminal domain-containing protein [Bacteroidota bacterium]